MQISTPSARCGDASAAASGSTVRPAAPVLNIANVLTVVRLALVPVFLWALLASDAPGWRWTALALFVAAAVTDRLDGFLARRLHLVTDFGKLVDPIADKALIGGALIGLSLLGSVPWWMTGVILAREIGITAARLALARDVVLPAGRGGKLKTLVQAVAIVAYLLPVDAAWLDVTAVSLMLLAVALTVVTGLDYLVSMAKVRAARQ